MCELLAMSTRHTAHLTFSLEALASHSGPTSGTRDGWGAAYYQSNDVAQFREIIPVIDSPLVHLLENRGLAQPLQSRTSGAPPSVRSPFQTPNPLCANWSGACTYSPITDICQASRDHKVRHSIITIRLGTQTPNTLFAPC